MYIRRVLYQDGYHYLLRETCRDDGRWTHRDLMDLGPNPGDYIEYPGGNGFYFKAELEEALEAGGVGCTSEDLDYIFLPFLKPDIRRIIERSYNPYGPQRFSKACPREELAEHQSELHSFDKRRLHFLRFGRVDIGQLEGRSWKFLDILSCKCRDEIETIIDSMESALRPHETGSYIFTALHLQSYFPGHLLRNQPEGLDQEKLDNILLEEICSLNEDSSFFAGVHERTRGTLHPFLRKYVILYFDHEYSPHVPWSEYIRRFQERHRAFGGIPLRPSMHVDEALKVLDVSPEDFQGMTRGELARWYRDRAKKKHPDRGGDHEAFIRLTSAYEALLTKK